MKAEREDLLVEQIRQECRACLAFVKGVDRRTFLADSLIQHAVGTSVIVIGQIVADLVRTAPDFVAAHGEIPWTSIIGMRNRIAHNYYALDFEVIWDTVLTSIPELLASLPSSGG